MDKIKCFFYEPSTEVKRTFRRYETGNCPGKNSSFHNAQLLRDIITVPVAAKDEETDPRLICRPPSAELREKFPVKCDHCDFYFTESSEYQLNSDRLYTSAETKLFFTLRELPPGAMYFADWMLINRTSNLFRGPDNHCLAVILPDEHPWLVDSRASNCTLPEDNEHKCWVRHGEPPLITVDKNGLTCAAGAGSIQTSKWHGFLRNGFLEGC